MDRNEGPQRMNQWITLASAGLLAGAMTLASGCNNNKDKSSCAGKSNCKSQQSCKAAQSCKSTTTAK